MNINKNIFEKEINICREQYKKQKGCNWGECEKCGVVPLLVKLEKGKLIEDKNEVYNIREKYLK